MKNSIVGGLVAGLVAGSIIAGTAFLTKDDLVDVAVADGVPIRVTLVSTPGFAPSVPDGSEARPFFVLTCERNTLLPTLITC